MLNPISHQLQWKVCGMREAKNIAEVLLLEPNYMGFIFYEKSPRYVEGYLLTETLVDFPARTKKVGVFVNEEVELIIEIAKQYRLDYIQLHGSETPEKCKILKENGFGIIKAFLIESTFDFKQLESYLPFVDIFLFDTKAEGGYGGHGKAFNWETLLTYPFTTPFLLAGGVGLQNLAGISILQNLPLLGIDVNSKFEIEKGLKDVDELKKLKKVLNQINNNIF